MRNRFLLKLMLYCFLVAFVGSGNKANANGRSQTFETGGLKMQNTLSEYETDKCISDLLKSIVVANKEFYGNDAYFYALIFKKTNGNRYITIEATLWASPGDYNYLGVVKISGASFLIIGDIHKDDLFKLKKSTKIKLPLKKDKLATYPYANEPVLSGKYVGCTDKPIYLEVYVKGKIAIKLG